MKIIRRIGRLILIPLIGLLSLILLFLIAIQIPAVQTKVAKFAVEELNKSFGTEISVERVKIDFFGDVNLYGVSAKDEHNLDFIKIKRIQAGLSLSGLIRNPNKLTIRKLKLYDPEVQVITYKGEKTSNFISFVDRFSDKEKKEPSTFQMNGNIEVINGKLLIRSQNKDIAHQDWVDAENFNLDIRDFNIKADDIWLEIKSWNLDGKRKGENYRVDNFSGNFHYSPKEIRIENWNFKTADSEVNGHIVLKSENEGDMADFLNKVEWDMELKEGSKVNVKDIRYFVDNFDKNTTVELMGKVSGTLNNMSFKQLQLTSGGIFVASDEWNMIDMTDGDKLVIQTQSVKAKASYKELTELLPTFIANKIPVITDRFGNLDYRGDFGLNSERINAKGYAMTSLGDADLDVVLKNYRQKLNYSGTLITSNMNLKQIAETGALGFVKGRIEFDGVGTDIKDLKLRANGNLAYFDLLDKRYNNVSLNGRIENQRFNGYLSVRDSRMNMDYDGLFDFSKKPYRLNFTSKIQHLDLDYLGLTKDMKAVVKANVDGNFSFSNADNFLGSVEMSNFEFTSKEKNLNFEHAHIISSKTDDKQKLEIDIPTYIKGEVLGQFKMSQLADVLTNSIGKTALITYKPKKVDPGQNFHFYFEVEQDLFSFIDPRIEIAPGTILDGNVDTGSNSLVAELSSSKLGFDGINFYNPLINIDTEKETEQIYIRSDSLLAKGMMIYKPDIHTTPIEDSLKIMANFQLGREFPIDFDLNLFQTMDESKNLVFGFSPSTINIDGTDWVINRDNTPLSNKVIVNFDKKYYKLQQLSIESGEQSLLLDGYYASETDFKFSADMEELLLSELIPKNFLGDLKIDGLANGNVDITRSKTEFKPLMNLKVGDLALNGYKLGDLNVNGNYNVEQKVFDIELFIEQDQVQTLYANGFIDNKPQKPEINMVASLDDFNFKFVESFLSAAMSNMRGKVSGNVRFNGPVDSPDFEGMLDLKNLGFKIDYLNTDYSFDGVNTVPVSKQSGGQGYISLDEISFRDTAFNTKGKVTGQILFRDFATWFLNLSFNANNLLVLNTTPKQNDLFYGRVFGRGAFEIFGPPAKLDISANATVNDGSEFSINTGATKVEGSSSLVRFIPESEKDKKEEGGPKGMNIDLNISAGPGSIVHLIFDPVTEDMVKASGRTENLKFHLGRSGNISLEGIYTIESGRYEFRQVPLLNRNFDIKPGSFVRWNGGSPFNADMNITATFDRMVTNVGEYLGSGHGQTYEVVLGIVISESLVNPKMDFMLNIPRGGPEIQSLLNYKFNIDPEDRMIQFGSVLVLGQFMVNTENAVAIKASSTGAGIAIRQLGGIINSLIAGNGVSIGVDYVIGSDMSNTSDRFLTDLSVDLSPRWTFNGEVGVPMQSGYVNDVATGEAEIAWDISKKMDKSIVVNFFTRPTNFGVLNFGGFGNFQSFGAGVVYKTTFDRFSEMFKKEKPQSHSVQPTNEPPSLFDLFDKEEPVQQKEEQPKIETDTTVSKKVSINEKAKKQNGNGLVRFK